MTTANIQNPPGAGVHGPPLWLPDITMRLLDEALLELGHEENKSARLMAALTVTSGAIVTGILAGKWSPAHLSPLAATVWWFGVVVVVGALVLVGRAATYGDRPDTRLPIPGPPAHRTRATGTIAAGLRSFAGGRPGWRRG